MTYARGYVQGLDIDAKVARIESDETTRYYVGDALGSVTHLLDNSAAVLNTEVTNSWGESILDSQSVADRFGLSQREKDSESGVMHFRARFYDPRIGRFGQKDPLKVGLKPYVYAGNNPVQRTDPLGKQDSNRKAAEELLKTNLLTDSQRTAAQTFLETDKKAEALWKAGMELWGDEADAAKKQRGMERFTSSIKEAELRGFDKTQQAFYKEAQEAWGKIKNVAGATMLEPNPAKPTMVGTPTVTPGLDVVSGQAPGSSTLSTNANVHKRRMTLTVTVSDPTREVVDISPVAKVEYVQIGAKQAIPAYGGYAYDVEAGTGSLSIDWSAIEIRGEPQHSSFDQGVVLQQEFKVTITDRQGKLKPREFRTTVEMKFE